MHPKAILGLVVGGLVGLVILTIILGSWYTVDQTQRAILLRNGAFVGIEQPGLHFKFPWIDSVVKVDMQTHTRTWGWDQKSGRSTMETYSADQQPAFLRVSVTFRVAPDRVAEMYNRFGGDYDAAITRLITPRVYERVKVVFGQYTAARAITARGQLNAEAQRSLIDAIAYDPVFLIESVQIEDISFSPEYIKSVEQRMTAEVEVQRYRQQLEREKVQADIVETKANGQANAVRAQAKAEADAIKLRGEAEALAIAARGKALADNPALVALVQAEKWDGKLPVTMIPGGAVPMLNVGK